METNIWDIIAKVIAGTASEKEVQEVNDWIAENPQHKSDFESAEKAWEISGTIDPGFKPNVDAAWNKLQTAMQTESTPDNVVPLHSESRKRNKWVMGIAAACLVLLTSYFAIQYAAYDGNNGISYETVASSDQKQEVNLPDGSQVWLSPNSTLSYVTDFDGDTRQVKLNGEAFFEVTKDPKKPFVIETPISRTEVLGTSFLLRGSGANNESELIVRTGKVAFSGLKNSDNALTLEKGDRGMLKEGILEKSTTTDVNAFAIRTQSISLDNLTLEEAIGTLERYFGVEFEVNNDELLQLHLDDTQFDNPTLVEVVEVVSATLGCSQKIDGKTVHLSK